MENPQASKWWICDVRREKWSQMWTLTKGTYTGDKACRDPLQISSNNSSIQPSIWQLSSNRSRILTWFWHYKVLPWVCSSILRRIQCCRESKFPFYSVRLAQRPTLYSAYLTTPDTPTPSHYKKFQQSYASTMSWSTPSLLSIFIYTSTTKLQGKPSLILMQHFVNWPWPWKQQNKTWSSSRGLKRQFTSSVGLDLPTPRRSKVTSARPIPGRGTPVSDADTAIMQKPTAS